MAPVQEIPPALDPGTGGKEGGLGQRLRDALVSFLVGAWNRIRDSVAETFRKGVDLALESFEKPLLDMIRPFADQILDSSEVPEYMKAPVRDAMSGEHQVGISIALGLVGALVMGLFQGLVRPAARVIEHEVDRVARSNLIDFGTMVTLWVRGRVTEEQLDAGLERLGIDDGTIKALKEVARPLFSSTEMARLLWLDQLTPGAVDTELEHYGYNQAQRNMLMLLMKALPSASDLVRYGTREAWRDDVAERWQFDANRPGELDENMAKIGFEPWVAQAEWRAHWQLPSVQAGIEMYFRDAIELDDLRQLIVMLDIAPGWIKPILDTSRPLPGRIDRRWAFEEDIIGDEELYELYRADGMDEVWAQRMTDMVISRYASEAKGLTRASVTAAYKKRRVSRDEAVGLLGEIKIKPFLANWYLDQADLDLQDEALDRQKDLVETQFVKGLLSESRAREELLGIGLPSSEVEMSIDEWSLRRRTTTAVPSRSNLEEFYRQNVIGVDEFREQMAVLGYNTAYIGWYLDSLSYEKAQAAAEEEERAQKERIRVETERRESAYARAKAAIDQDIAELNAAIADAQVALVESQNERDRALEQALSATEVAALEAEYRPLFREVDAAIAQARLGIERLGTASQERNARINDLNRTIAAGRDLVVEERLGRQRAELQTEISRVAKAIASKRVDIASIEEAAATLESGEDIQAAQRQILTLEREIAELQEQQAAFRVQIEEIDEQLPVQLTADRRTELRAEVDVLEDEIDDLRVEREALQDDVRDLQEQRLALEHELEQQITALPGKVEQIEIRAQYDAQIDKIRARIQTLRANVSQLRLDKSELAVEWRSSGVGS